MNKALLTFPVIGHLFSMILFLLIKHWDTAWFCFTTAVFAFMCESYKQDNKES